MTTQGLINQYSSQLRNLLVRRLGYLKWYGSFLCDNCYHLDTNWHTVKYNGKYLYTHLKGQCIRSTAKEIFKE